MPPEIGLDIAKLGINAGGKIAGLLGMGILMNNRPQYEIPDAARAKLALAKSMVTQNVAPIDVARENADLALANAVKASSNDGLLPSLLASRYKTGRDLAAQESQIIDSRMGTYMGALDKYSQFEDQKWQMNEFAPYQEKMNLFTSMVSNNFIK